jgi:hypothetical protein
MDPLKDPAAGHYDPNTESPVPRLEDDIREMKPIIGQMLPMIVRIDAMMPHLATEVELAQLRSDLARAGQGLSLGRADRPACGLCGGSGCHRADSLIALR